MPRDLTNKTIIITGASSGIGAATALACARAGMNVLLTARRQDRLDEVAARVRAVGTRAETVAADVTDPGLSARLLDLAEDKLGGFHAVFANAGYGFDKSMTEVSMDELRRMFDVNFFAGVDLLQHAARRLIAAQRRGHLLTCSSILSRFALPGYGPYSATKSAQALICRAMRMELRPHVIKVSSVHPIQTVTEFSDVSHRLSATDAAPALPHPRAPGLFVQPADRVARAVVSCLRRPRPEVWTSMFLRIVSGLMTLAPATMDRAIRLSYGRWHHSNRR